MILINLMMAMRQSCCTNEGDQSFGQQHVAINIYNICVMAHILTVDIFYQLILLFKSFLCSNLCGPISVQYFQSNVDRA